MTANLPIHLIQLVAGQTVASEFAAETAIAAIEARGFRFVRPNANPSHRPEIQGQPKFEASGTRYTLGASQTASHAFNIPMLLRRGSRKGQSLVFAVNLIIGAGILSWFFALPLFAATYRTPCTMRWAPSPWRAPKYMRPGKEEANG